MNKTILAGGALLISLGLAGAVYAADTYKTPDGGLTTTHPDSWNQCGSAGAITAGPQSPRNIESPWGTNTTRFGTALSTDKMNMCNVHFHWNAEHKSTAYSTFVNTGNEHAGFAIVKPKSLDPVYRAEHDISHLLEGEAHEIGVIVGDTIEVHWVHTSCKVDYETLDHSKGLGNCLTSVCSNPQLRVVAQVFKVVEHDADVTSLDKPMKHYDPTVVYTGSTTGASFNNNHCSPFQVTWDVKKTAATIDAHALAHWAHEKGEHGHGVRELVDHNNLLSPIKSSRYGDND